MSMIFCRGCGKELHESATTCPHCGALQQSANTVGVEKKPWGTGRMIVYSIFSLFPLIGLIAGIVGVSQQHTRKQGMILLGIAFMSIVIMSFMKGFGDGGSSSSSKVDNQAELAAMPAAPLSPTGELAAMFNLMSDNTDLQRENKLKEIKGKVVEWTLQVYEVEKDGDDYKVQTEAGNAVGTLIYISPRNEQDKAVIEALKTGNRISIKGIIKDDFMRSLVIKPAILFQPSSTVPIAMQAAQLAPAMSVVTQAPAEQATQQNTGVCAEIYKQAEVNFGDNDVQCSVREFEIADKELNVVYKKVMAVAGKQKDGLTSEQVAWIKTRDRECDEVIHGLANPRQMDLTKNDCLTEKTRKRVAELEMYL